MSTEHIKFPEVITLRAAAPGARAKGVDKENRMMSGVVVAQAMQIKDYRGSDYGLELDTAFLQDMYAFVRKQKQGVLSNFGHNYNNLGRRLGRMNNFTLEGDTLYSDINIFRSADTSPGLNGLGTHVLEQAEEDPGSMMFSINFSY